MQEPCSSCPERDKDYGGCRCQAFALTGDAAAADPVCTKSPQRYLVDEALQAAAEAESGSSQIVYRTAAASKEIIASAR